ncbi:MAG: nucleoside deaminase, partial [Candidatus Gastranaerophilales bacterium]|nr:nucleoside deaminase [Candidatus Gastranaerophilales bacterium]
MTMLNNYFDILINKLKEEKADIPIAAMIVKDNEIISIKTNEREKSNLITAHAEILAINEANQKLNNKYLTDCDMYVTLEPCP